MNLQCLVVVVIRLVALNFFVNAAVQLAPQILRFTAYSPNAYSGNLDMILAMPWMVVTGLVCGALLLWVFALPIARLVTMDLPAEISLGRLSLADCYSVAFMGMGLFFIASRFGTVLYYIYYVMKAGVPRDNSAFELAFWPGVFQAFVPFLLGIILFVNGRKWAIAFARRIPENDVPFEPPSPEPESKSDIP